MQVSQAKARQQACSRSCQDQKGLQRSLRALLEDTESWRQACLRRGFRCEGFSPILTDCVKIAGRRGGDTHLKSDAGEKRVLRTSYWGETGTYICWWFPREAAKAGISTHRRQAHCSCSLFGSIVNRLERSLKCIEATWTAVEGQRGRDHCSATMVLSKRQRRDAFLL